MTFKQKRRAKKLGKIFFTLAYVMVILFILTLVLLFTGVINHDTVSEIQAMALFFIPMASALILAGIGQGYGLTRAQYKMKIRLYRENRQFNMALDSIEAGDFPTAIDIYNSMPFGYLREFIYSHLLAYFSLGKHTDGNKEQAISKINELREKYCQHNVKF